MGTYAAEQAETGRDHLGQSRENLKRGYRRIVLDGHRKPQGSAIPGHIKPVRPYPLSASPMFAAIGGCNPRSPNFRRKRGPGISLETIEDGACERVADTQRPHHPVSTRIRQSVLRIRSMRFLVWTRSEIKPPRPMPTEIRDTHGDSVRVPMVRAQKGDKRGQPRAIIMISWFWRKAIAGFLRFLRRD